MTYFYVLNYCAMVSVPYLDLIRMKKDKGKRPTVENES